MADLGAESPLLRARERREAQDAAEALLKAVVHALSRAARRSSAEAGRAAASDGSVCAGWRHEPTRGKGRTSA